VGSERGDGRGGALRGEGSARKKTVVLACWGKPGKRILSSSLASGEKEIPSSSRRPTGAAAFVHHARLRVAFKKIVPRTKIVSTLAASSKVNTHFIK